MKRIVTIILIVFFYINSLAQTAKIDSLKEVINTSKIDSIYIINCNKIAQYYLDLKSLDSCEIYSDLALKIAKKISFKNGIADSYHKKGVASYYKNDLKSAIGFFKKEVDLLEDTSQEKLKSLEYIGLFYQSLNKLDSAVLIYNKLLEISKSKNDYESISSVYNQLGVINKVRGNYDMAFEYYYKSTSILDSIKKITIDIAKLSKINTFLSNTYANIAGIYTYLKNTDKAISMYKKAYRIKEENKDSIGFSTIISNIGAAYYFDQKFDSALYYFKKSLKYDTDVNERTVKQNSLLNLGSIYIEIKEYDKALKYTNSYIKLSKELGDSLGIIRGYVNLSGLYYSISRYNRVVYYSNLGLDYTKRKKIIRMQAKFYKFLADVNNKTNNFKEALNYYQLYKETSDSIFNIDKAKIITEIETKYETEKKEQLIKEQENQLKIEKTENILKQSEIENEKNQKYAIALGLFLLIIVLYFVIRNLKQRKKHLELKLKTKAISENLKGQEQERIKIAEELHDDIGGTLASTKLLIERLEKANPELVELSKINNAIESSYKYIRLTSHQLAHFSKLNKTLLEGVEEFIDSIQHTQNAVITYQNKLNIKLNKISEQLKINIYRTIQELIINAVKHSAANNITLIISNNENVLNIVVLDDGKGFSNSKKHGIGLSNIKDRLKEIGGEIEIETEENEGSTINIRIPI